MYNSQEAAKTLPTAVEEVNVFAKKYLKCHISYHITYIFIDPVKSIQL